MEPDTTPEADAAQIAAYRRMGGAARSAIAFRLTAMARQAAESGIRARHPEYDEAQVRRALLRLRHGDEAARCVWPGEDLVAPSAPALGAGGGRGGGWGQWGFVACEVSPLNRDGFVAAPGPADPAGRLRSRGSVLRSGRVATVTFGDFEWDVDKATANARRHGVSFEEATTVFLDLDYLLIRDAVEADRFVAIGVSVQVRTPFVVHCERGERLRIISARRATRAERETYERRHRSD